MRKIQIILKTIKNEILFESDYDYLDLNKSLVEFDREEIEKAGYNTDTMVIVTNTRDYKNIATANEGTVKAGEPILVVEA